MKLCNMATILTILSTFPLFAEDATQVEKVANPPATTKEGAIVELTTANYASTLKNSKYLIVDVYSDRCYACKLQAPELDKFNRENGTRYTVAKLKSTPANQSIVDPLNIEGLPTLIFFKDGKEVDRILGFTPSDGLLKKAKAVF